MPVPDWQDFTVSSYMLVIAKRVNLDHVIPTDTSIKKTSKFDDKCEE